jgi:hypothetical protein
VFTRAPCTRIESWRSAPCGADDGVLFGVVLLIERTPGNLGDRRFSIPLGAQELPAAAPKLVPNGAS